MLLATLLVSSCSAAADGPADDGGTPASSAADATGVASPLDDGPSTTIASDLDDGPGQVVTGEFDVALGEEISGAAAGRAVEGLWIVDDRRGTDQVHLVALDGTHLGSIRIVREFRTRNVEDVAVGPCPDDPATSCVHVGDIGDNATIRPYALVLAMPEELLADVPPGTVVDAEPVERRYEWPGGARDAEALAVAPDGTVVIIDKTPDTATVGIGPRDGGTMELVTWELPSPPLIGLARVVGHTVTAADIDAEGATMAVRTYDQILLLEPPDGVVSAESLADLPMWDVTDVGRVARELQGESVTLLGDGRVATIGEGSTAITVTTPE